MAEFETCRFCGEAPATTTYRGDPCCGECKRAYGEHE